MLDSFVSKDSLYEAINLSMHTNPHKDGKIRANHNYEHLHFMRIVYHAPGADVRPVVHARWVHHYHDSGELIDDKWYCSECHMCGDYKRSWYCPHCGAKMDLESEGTDE